MALLSDTYVDVSEADAYHQNHNPGGGWSSASQQEKEAAINNATKWLETVPDWIGNIKDTDQALAWPRDVTYDNDGRKLDTPYPQAVKDACNELALEALDGPLVLTVGKNDRIKSVKAGSVEVEFEDYAGEQKDYRLVWNILSAVSRNSSNTVDVIRVQ